MDNKIMKIMKIDYDKKVWSFVFIIFMLVSLIMILVVVLSNNENKYYVLFLYLAVPIAYMFTKTKAFDYYIPPRKIYNPEVFEYDTPSNTVPSDYGIIQKNANRNDIKDTIAYTGELNKNDLDQINIGI